MQLLDCLGRQSLLPNLRLLRLGVDVTTELNEADCFFLCPNLSRLEIRCRDLRYFFPRIVQVVPSLQHLDIPDQAIPTHLIPLIRNLHQLQTLRTKNKFIISAESPLSEHLITWRAGSVVLSQTGTGRVNPTQFTALTTLELINPISMDDVASLFEHSVFPKLLNITFVAPSYDGGFWAARPFKESWLNLCAALFSENHLEFIYILANKDNEVIEEEAEMDLGDFFVTAKQQTALRKFWMGEPRLLEPLTRASIGSMCTTFPSLSDIYIQLRDSYTISFDDLAVLANQLPLLQKIEIRIDGTTLTDPPSVPILSHSLEEIGIEGSLIVDPFLFAHYIDRLFPFAEIRKINVPSNDEQSVISAYKLVRACRKDQERRSIRKPSRKK